MDMQSHTHTVLFPYSTFLNSYYLTLTSLYNSLLSQRNLGQPFCKDGALVCLPFGNAVPVRVLYRMHLPFGTLLVFMLLLYLQFPDIQLSVIEIELRLPMQLSLYTVAA